MRDMCMISEYEYEAQSLPEAVCTETLPPIIHALWEEVWPDARTTEQVMWGPEILRSDWWLLCNLVLVFVVQGRSVFQQVSVTTCLEDASLGLKIVEPFEK